MCVCVCVCVGVGVGVGVVWCGVVWCGVWCGVCVIFFFFFSNWEKSHLNPIGKGAEFPPLRRQKKIPAIRLFSQIGLYWIKYLLQLEITADMLNGP